jgi:hypothetical protein
MAIMMVPATVGLTLSIPDTMKPEQIANTKNAIMKGS